MVTELQAFVEAVQEHLTLDLVRNPWKTRIQVFGAHPHTGHCYVASEALYHWVAKDAGFRPKRVKHERIQHWFLYRAEDGMILDLTAAQFSTPVPYERAVGSAFITKTPSARCRELLQRISDGQRPQV